MLLEVQLSCTVPSLEISPVSKNEHLDTSRSRGKDSPGRGISAEQRGQGHEYAMTYTMLLEECLPDENTQHMHQWPSRW